MSRQRNLAIIGLIVALLASVSSGHICMWRPMQRGAISIDIPGDPACYRPYPIDQCGNSPVGAPKTTLKASSTLALEFQQNLNHWYPQNPGHFDAYISYKYANVTEKDFIIPFGAAIPDYAAHDMLTITNFTITGTVPNKPCPHCVLRLRYVSNNPDEVNNHHGNNPSATFYQCADITIV